MANKTIFSFDLGTGSVGECVRVGSEIKHIDSLIIPHELASIKEAAKRRRQLRTRLAHQARENWWRKQAAEAGLEVLESHQPTAKNPDAKPDPRLLREFPAKGDSTIYTSSLLRIALLQGVPLKGWQVYKAIWSALQHRGYDAELPWKTNTKRNVSEENETIDEQPDNDGDEKENMEAVGEYASRLNDMSGNKDKFKYPCYYEAYRMGIWTPQEPHKLAKDKNHGSNPNPARNRNTENIKAIPSRQIVEKEIHDLLIKAAEQYPKLTGKADYILYGPAEQAYASYKNPDYRRIRGRDEEWKGVLSQKVPRFDNRIISKCSLIPRLNVCKAEDELNQDYVFLISLKNMRYFSENNQELSLTHHQIHDLFNEHKDKKRITQRDWKKYVKQELNGEVKPTQLKVEAPKTGGRSRFCRPALKTMNQLILSGESPHDRYNEFVTPNMNTDPKKGLIKSDYQFLLDMPKEWNNLHVPDQRMRETEITAEEREKTIEKIINRVNDPVVRHRLRFFKKRIETLKSKHGIPDKLVIEFVRDADSSFMGKKGKKDFINDQNKNRKSRDQAFKKLKDAEIKGNNALEKMMLFEEQAGKDLYAMGKSRDFYTGEMLSLGNLKEYEIDHIVPREDGGPDAYINKILTTNANNGLKGKRTPYQWFQKIKPEAWPLFLQWVQESNLHPKKKALLTSENAEELVQKFTGLAQTAYISKLAQRIASLVFDWPQMTAGSERKIIVANGGYTAKIRRRLGLNKLLHPNVPEEQIKSWQDKGDIDKKNRENKRHHALDALVISVIPEIRIENGKDRYPNWFIPDFCKETIEKVYPTPVALEKPEFDKTPYGLRKVYDKGGTYHYDVVTKYNQKGKTTLKYFEKLENATKDIDKIYSQQIREDFKAKLATNPKPEEWENFIADYKVRGAQSKPKKITLISSGGIQEHELSSMPYGNIGKIEGQYYFSSKHKGQIIYQNERSTWKVIPIYAFESLHLKEQEIKKVYGEDKTYFFRSGQMVEIQNDCNMNNQNNQIIKGIYKLNTIETKGDVVLTSMEGIQKSTKITTLMRDGKMRLWAK